MSKLIDAAFGIHPKALALGARRLEVLAANMANADTPGYKARDIDFRSALRSDRRRWRRTARAHARASPGRTRRGFRAAQVPRAESACARRQYGRRGARADRVRRGG